jgi:hypothetical protein
LSHKSNSFFNSPGKVAGTFTAVGVVVVGLVAGVLYCCCVGAACFGRRNDHDRFSNDESSVGSANQEKAYANIMSAKAVNNQSSPQMYTSSTNDDNSLESTSPIKRNPSSKSIFNIFNSGDNGIARTASKKKLNTGSKPANELNDIVMFPINEFDVRLNPDTMFLNHNFSNKSLDDDQDYSRKLRVANP